MSLPDLYFKHKRVSLEEMYEKVMSKARRDIRDMSTDDLLDMDYFLHEDVFGEDSFGEEGFYIF